MKFEFGPPLYKGTGKSSTTTVNIGLARTADVFATALRPAPRCNFWRSPARGFTVGGMRPAAIA